MKKMISKPQGCAGLLLALAAGLILPSDTKAQNDLETLKARLKEYHCHLYSTSAWWPEPSEGEIAAYFDTIGADGGWSAEGPYHLNYADPGGGIWEPMIHFARLEAMAAAVKRPGSSDHGDPAKINKVMLGLDYILSLDPPINSSNRYHMAMGRNIPLRGTALLMEHELNANPTLKGKVISQLYYGIKPDASGVYGYYYPSPGITAGQNLNWLADIHLHAALLKNSATEVDAAAAVLRSLAAPADGDEGIFPDNSFMQHGAQLQTAAYGSFFAEDMARNIRLFSGLSYAFNAAQIAVIRGYILDGQRWMIRRGHWETHVLGRQLAEKNETRLHPLSIKALEDMKVGDPESAAAYQSMLDHIKGIHDAELVGNKHFYLADYAAHRRPGYSFHTRMSSVRVAITENGNNENIQNKYLAQGGNSLLLEGDEYLNIFPCWRWDRIPGTTAPQRNPSELKTASWAVLGTQHFVVGVSNGMYGASAMDLNWDGISGKKSWFYFDDDIVCLGAGISFSGDREVFTTLNQTLRKSEVYAETGTGDGTPVPAGEAAPLANPKWVHHGNVGYFFPAAAEAELENKTIEGNWHSINQNTYPNPTKETKDRFMLSIKHGKNPSDGSYAYILLPAHDRAFVRSYAATPQSRVISNTPSLQAVRNDLKKVASLIFWSAGKAVLNPEQTISVDKPCMVLVDESGADINVSVSSYQADTVNLILGSTTDLPMVFELPGGANAGMSVKQTYPSPQKKKR